MRTLGTLVVMTFAAAGCAGGGGQPAATPAGVQGAPAASGGASDPGAPPGRAAPEATECRRPEMVGPVIVSEAIYAARTGHDSVRLSQLKTTVERPLEECGLRTILERLATLTCDDGSNPFKGDLRAAHASRVGNLGAGGRCGSILDQYDVPCREQTYAVHADMYLCTEKNVDSWLE